MKCENEGAKIERYSEVFEKNIYLGRKIDK
jgi:hypothetical protein